MRTVLPLSLFAILVISVLPSIAQDQFAYAITDVAKEGSSWRVLRKLDLKTGQYSSVLLDGMNSEASAFDAITKKNNHCEGE